MKCSKLPNYPFRGFQYTKGLFPIARWGQSSNELGPKHKKICLSETTRTRALILRIVDLYQVCSYCLWRPNMAPPRMSHVLFVEVLHPVNFVNITHVKSQWNCWSIKIHSLTLRGAMLSYAFINSHSQVSDTGPKGPLAFKMKLLTKWVI